MKKFGGYLVFFGLGSIALYFLEYEFIILSWIELWGETVAWVIRIAMAVVGAIMWVVGNAQEEKLEGEPVEREE